MNIKEALDFAATVRPAWKSPGGSWNRPFCYTRETLFRVFGASKKVSRLTKSDLAKGRAQLIAEGYAPSTCNRTMSMLNTALSELLEAEIIDKAPKLKPLKEDNQRKEFFTREKFKELLEAATEVFDNPELADAMLFAVYTGCRRGELLELEVRDVELDKNLLTFRDTKNGTDHILDIHPHMVEMLRKRTQHFDASEKVFHFHNADELWNAYVKVRDHVGLNKKYVWHTFRHTCGTWMAERGIPIQSIAKVLNHKSISTSERYVKVMDEARKTAIHSL